MKTFKKLLAVMLSVLMLLSVVVVPATAEDSAAETTISKYISLLDLSGTTLNNKEVGMPSGIAGAESFYTTNIGNHFTGNQEIIANADGSRSWKIHFDTATSSGGYLNGYNVPGTNNTLKNLVSVKFAIPAQYAKLVSGIKLDYTNGVVSGGDNTPDTLVAQFGISDGTLFSGIKKTGSTDIAATGTSEGTRSVLEANVNDLYKVTGAQLSSEKKGIAEDYKWSYGTEFAFIYVVMSSRRCEGTEGSWAAINDLGITLTGTEDDFADITTTETYDLLKLDEMELGMVGTDTEFVDGVEEFIIKNNNSNSSDMTAKFAGTKEVIEENGKRALKLDLECGVPFARTATDTQSARNRVFEGGYHSGGNGTVFMLQLKVPKNHVKLIDSIKIGVNKQTTADVVYAFGVTDGKYYSKIGNAANYYYDGTKTGYVGVDITNYKNSYVFDRGSVGSYKNVTERWGDNEFTHLFLLLSADEALGYVSISEISYTITATLAEYKEYQGFITDFERKNDGVVTENAISGKMAYQWSVPAGNAYHTRNIDIGGNQNASKATGFSFWVNNPNSGGPIKLKVRLMKSDKSVAYFIGDYITIPANSNVKLTADFSNIRIDTTPSNAGNSIQDVGGAYVALTPEQIAELDTLSVLCRTHDLDGDGTTRDVYVNLDNVKYTFDTPIPNGTVDLSAATGEGVTVTEDGKVEFASDTITIPGTELEDGTTTEDTVVGSDIVATIPVSDKFFRYADKMTLNLDNNNTSAVKYRVTLHGTNDSGVEAHWKWGYKDWTRSLDASVTDSSVELPMGGHASAFNNNTIHEGTKDTSTCANCNPSTQDGWGGSSGHQNNPPSAAERDSITYIQIRVFDNLGSGEKVVLNSITVSYSGNNISANVVSGAETGTINLDATKGVEGDTVGFFVTPADKKYVKSLEVVDSKGNAVAYGLSTEYNFENYYVFKMPADDVTVKANFEAISTTLEGTTDYDNATDTVKFNYHIPVLYGEAYNEELDAFQTFNNYGVIITSEEALAKYDIDFESLTPEKVAELKESGHHVANYIAVIDSKTDKVNESGFSCDFAVDIEGITIRARRAPLLIKNYINFVDAEGVVAPYYEATDSTIDERVYGEFFKSEFSAYYGVNVSQVAQGAIDPTDKKVSLALGTEFWNTIADKGFDHVRLPVKLANYIDENGELIEEQMQKIETMVDNALKAGLCLVLDVHGFKDINYDYAGNCDAFQAAWDKFSARFEHLPLSVAFEIINEPRFDKTTVTEKVVDEVTGETTTVEVPAADPMTNADLFELQTQALATIRGDVGNETRIVILSTEINQAYWLDNVKGHDIFKEENIMVDIHDYSPTTFTYSGADWSNLGTPEGADTYSNAGFVTNISRIQAFCEATNVPVIIGEYGAYRPEANAKLKYIAEFNATADEYGIPRCMWELWSAFGPYNVSKDEWNDDLVNAIMNPEDYLPEAEEVA